MIQVQSILKVADNSGGRLAQCIRIIGKSKAKTASVGDLITVSIKKLCHGLDFIPTFINPFFSDTVNLRFEKSSSEQPLQS